MKNYTSIIYLTIITFMCAACVQPTNVENLGNNTYRITYIEDSLITNTHPSAMQYLSNQQCPQGYEKLNEKFMPDNGASKDIWTVKCLKQ